LLGNSEQASVVVIDHRRRNGRRCQDQHCFPIRTVN
jgi:hypothetical protein